jgi:hypothetical protein
MRFASYSPLFCNGQGNCKWLVRGAPLTAGGPARRFPEFQYPRREAGGMLGDSSNQVLVAPCVLSFSFWGYGC